MGNDDKSDGAACLGYGVGILVVNGGALMLAIWISSGFSWVARFFTIIGVLTVSGAVAFPVCLFFMMIFLGIASLFAEKEEPQEMPCLVDDIEEE